MRLISAFEPNDASVIASLELPEQPQDDYMFWNFHRSGRFTVKSGYLYLKRSSMPSGAIGREDMFKVLWSLRILPKWKHFIWKLLWTGIATKSNLGRRRGLQISMDCDLCGSQEEDLQHLFRFCIAARDVWRVESCRSTQKLTQTNLYKIGFCIISAYF